MIIVRVMGGLFAFGIATCLWVAIYVLLGVVYIGLKYKS